MTGLSSSLTSGRRYAYLNGLSCPPKGLHVEHSSRIGGELRELRCHYERELNRILYRRSRNLIVLLHAFRKDTDTVPQGDIQEATDR